MSGKSRLAEALVDWMKQAEERGVYLEYRFSGAAPAPVLCEADGKLLGEIGSVVSTMLDACGRLPEAERRAKEAAKAAGVEQETLNRVLERLAALEQDNRRLQADNEKRDVAYEKLAADYTQLKEKYIEETADRQQPEQAEAEE